MKVFFVIVVLFAGIASAGTLVREGNGRGRDFMRDLTRCDNCNTPILPGVR